MASRPPVSAGLNRARAKRGAQALNTIGSGADAIRVQTPRAKTAETRVGKVRTCGKREQGLAISAPPPETGRRWTPGMRMENRRKRTSAMSDAAFPALRAFRSEGPRSGPFLGLSGPPNSLHSRNRRS